MSDTTLSEQLFHAEGLIIQEQDEQARELLLRLAEDVEEYVDRNCPTTDELQWFSFPTVFERLCYRRVEGDPRELRDVGEPFDRMYADLGLVDVRVGDYDHAIESLKQAVRWNPMGCEHRLNLADLFMVNGDTREALALAYSVFERASHAEHIVRAYVIFAGWFARTSNERAAAACLHAAQRLDMPDSAFLALKDQVEGTDADPSTLTDEETDEVLQTEGLPTGANAEVAICLLMCASDSAAAGDKNTATELTVRARDLVGEPAAMALLRLIRESDADASADANAGGDASAGVTEITEGGGADA